MRGHLCRAGAGGKITSGGISSWFAGVVSAGFDAAVNERANDCRWPRGKIRYQLAMLRELAYADGERIGALPMTIEVVPLAVCVLA